jgi:peptide subunit release factor RF-3
MGDRRSYPSGLTACGVRQGATYRLRDVTVITFVNKLDRKGYNRFDGFRHR